MKISNRYWLFLLFMLPLTLFAGGDSTIQVAAGSGTSKIMLLLIPILVPMLIALARTEIPKLPKWLLPILAPALGALIDWVTSLATGTAPNPIAAAVLGAAGTGLREIKDQVQKKFVAPPTP